MDHLKFAQYYHTPSMGKMRDKKLELLKQIDVNYCIPYVLPKMRDWDIFPGYTILHAAVVKCESDLVYELTNRGADILKQGTANGISPIHLSFNKILTTQTDRSFWKKIEEHSQRKNVKALLSIHVKTNNTFNPKCKDGLSHFHIACCVDDTDAVDFFLKAGEYVDQIVQGTRHSLSGHTPLHCAIQFSSIKTIEILLARGANVKLKDSKGRSPIHLLIDLLIDVAEFSTMGKRTLHSDYEKELKDIKLMIKLLLIKIKILDVNFTDDIGFTAFHLACMSEDLSIMEDFLTKGANIDRAVNNNSELWPGWTPLHFAACSSIETFKFLMRNGANVSAKNVQGETPLEFCMMRFTPVILHSILSIQEKFHNIMLSDGSTRFLDLLIAMNNKDSFAQFLQNLSDVNITVAADSPIWPGYSLLHLSVAMNEKTKGFETFQDARCITIGSIRVGNWSADKYNCTESEEAIFLERISMCLTKGCSVSMKNTEDLSPIHLAFKLRKTAALNLMLSKCEEDVADPNNLSHLHIACLANDMDLVQRLLSQGSNVNSPMGQSVDGYKTPANVWLGLKPLSSKILIAARSAPLHIAAVLENAAMVEYLLQQGADVYTKDELERTPIHRSMEATDFGPAIAQQLIRATPDLTNCNSRDGLSHLHVAAFADEHQVVDKLLREGASVDQMVEVYGPFAGETPLHVAVRAGSVNAALSLLRNGASVHVTHPTRKFSSPLQYAMNNYKHATMACIIMKLSSEGRGVGALDDSGVTLLHLFCALGECNWAKRLLESGADPNAQIRHDEEYGGRWRGKRPLHTMLCEIETDGMPASIPQVANLLLTCGAYATADDGDSTPLHIVIDIIRKNYMSLNLANQAENANELNRLLLTTGDILLKHQKSYDVNPVGRRGISHFHYACSRNDVDVMKKFLDSGVSVNELISPFASDNAGETPLHFALENRQKEAALFLINNGADVKAEDVRGNTPLHALLEESMDLELVDILLDRGADINAKNFSLQTPLGNILGRHRTLTLESISWFLNRGYKIDFFETGQYNYGIIAEIMQSVNPDEFPSMLKTLFETCDLKKAIEEGFNPICSLVSITNLSQFKLENYIEAIERLMELGCDIDFQRQKGKSALYDAIHFHNAVAVKSLLLLGSDLNVVDRGVHFTLSIDEFRSIGLQNEMAVAKVLADHIWKTKLVNLKCCEHVNEPPRSFEELFPLDDHTSQYFYDEIVEMENTYVSETVTVKDFLSDLGAVAAYPRMLAAQRLAIDDFFKNRADLRENFPEYCGLLLVQYKKLLARLELLEPARNALHVLLPIKLPHLCIEAVLRYLTNDEMKILIQT